MERGREGRLREEHQQRVRQSYTDWLRRKAAARRKECQQERESVLHKMAVEVEVNALSVHFEYMKFKLILVITRTCVYCVSNVSTCCILRCCSSVCV